MELPSKPNMIVKPPMREQWLAERRKGVGGSDAAAAVGLSKWMTRYMLWLDKRGELQREETDAMRWGTAMEPLIRQEYANRTGCEVLVPDVMYQHPKHTFALVNVDGLVLSRGRHFEAKMARTAEGWGEPGTDEVPVEYNLQQQHGLAITGLEGADIAVLIGGNDLRIYYVEADLELQAMLLEQEAAFWRMVEENTPPPPETQADVKLRWKVASSGKKHEATQEEAFATLALRSWKDKEAQAKAKKEELETLLQTAMKDAAELVWDGETLATWKNVNASPRFDLDRFKAEQPELFAQYLRVPEASRRFLLKLKG